ncbi:hypothetical protein SDC9_64075 [bioreactor metagenome]|uniref:Uncharacterized protein n=1 Tax=bioreactor metagenome TaxID=1076179 RepID=A0A644XPK7_9ZZZZ
MSNVQITIDKKIKGIGNAASKSLGGDAELNRLIEIESKKIFRDKDILSTNDLVANLKKKIADGLGVEADDEIEIAAKKIVKEIRLQEKEDPKTVDEFRKESLTKEIVEGYKKANEGIKITAEQEKAIGDQATLVAETFYTGKGIDIDTRDELLSKDLGVEKAKMPLAFTDLEGTVKLLQKTPGQIKELQGKYEAVRNGLSGLNQPTNIRELTSFNSLAGALKNEGVMTNFNLGQSKFLSLVDRIDTFGGGAIRRTVGSWGENLVSKLGTESSKAILENGLKVFAKEGFQAGFNATLQGFLGGGAAAAGTTAAAAAGGAGAAAGAVATGAAAAGATLATGGIAAIVFAAKAVLDGIKKIGQKIIDGINNLVANGRGEDEDINKLTKKKWFIPVMIIIFLLTGCTLQNNNVSTLVSPTKDDEAEYTGEYGVSVLQEGVNDFKVPTCDPDGKNPNGNNRLILREIALSVVGKITYSGFNVWHQQGASPLWNTRVPESYDWAKSGGKYLYDKNGNHIIDAAKAKKRAMYPFYGLDCGGIAKWLWYQCMIDSWNKPNIGDWIYYSKKEMYGLDEVHLESVNDLKIGDVFERTIPESKPMCLKLDKKTGQWYENGCHHFAIYIGNGQVIEEVGNGGDPTLTTVTKVTPEYVTIDRDDQYGFKYYHVYRVTDVFKD